MILQPPKTSDNELDAYLYSLNIAYNELYDATAIIDGSVDSNAIAAAAVTADKIAANAVTAEKMYFNIRTVDSNYTAQITDYTVLVNAALGDRYITLPSALVGTNKVFNIKKIDVSANLVYIVGNVDYNPLTSISTPLASLTVHSDGTSWYTI